MNTSTEMLMRVQQVVADYAEIGPAASVLQPNDNLFNIGMSSRASVGVMMGLEAEFNIEFPEPLMKRETFESLESITNAVANLLQTQQSTA